MNYEENSDNKISYYPSSPLHIPSSFKEHPSLCHFSVLDWIIASG